METQKYIIREYNDSDLNGVLDLWEKYSGWGRPSEEEYKKWNKTPFGECIIIVAEDNKREIVGQLTFTPTVLLIAGKKNKALKMSAPIIHGKHRATNVMEQGSLMLQIFIGSNQIIKTKDYDWLYNFPAVGWAKIMGLIHKFGLTPWKINFHECFEIIDQAPLDTACELHMLDSFPEEMEKIWETFKIKNENKSFVTRNLEWLEYKWGGDLKIGIYNSAGELTGYAVIKKQTGLILDFISLNPEETPAILVGLKQLFDKQIETLGVSNPGLKFMQTSFLDTNLGEVKVRKVEFQFVFGLSALKDFDKLEKIDFSDWYVFPND